MRWFTHSCTRATHPRDARREEEERVTVSELGTPLTDDCRIGFGGVPDTTIVAGEMAASGAGDWGGAIPVIRGGQGREMEAGEGGNGSHSCGWWKPGTGRGRRRRGPALLKHAIRRALTSPQNCPRQLDIPGKQKNCSKSDKTVNKLKASFF